MTAAVALHAAERELFATEESAYYKPNETFMAVVCPICKSSAQELHVPGTQQASIVQLMVTLRLPTPSLRRQRQRTTPETNGRLHWTRQSNERNLTIPDPHRFPPHGQ